MQSLDLFDIVYSFLIQGNLMRKIYAKISFGIVSSLILGAIFAGKVFANCTLGQTRERSGSPVQISAPGTASSTNRGFTGVLLYTSEPGWQILDYKVDCQGNCGNLTTVSNQWVGAGTDYNSLVDLKNAYKNATSGSAQAGAYSGSGSYQQEIANVDQILNQVSSNRSSLKIDYRLNAGSGFDFSDKSVRIMSKFSEICVGTPAYHEQIKISLTSGVNVGSTSLPSKAYFNYNGTVHFYNQSAGGYCGITSPLHLEALQKTEPASSLGDRNRNEFGRDLGVCPPYSFYFNNGGAVRYFSSNSGGYCAFTSPEHLQRFQQTNPAISLGDRNPDGSYGRDLGACP